jgi:hypothetical protein
MSARLIVVQCSCCDLGRFDFSSNQDRKKQSEKLSRTSDGRSNTKQREYRQPNFAGFAECETVYHWLTSCFLVSPCTKRQKHPVAACPHAAAEGIGPTERNAQMGYGFLQLHKESGGPDRAGRKEDHDCTKARAENPRDLASSLQCSFLAIPVAATGSPQESSETVQETQL